MNIVWIQFVLLILVSIKTNYRRPDLFASLQIFFNKD